MGFMDEVMKHKEELLIKFLDVMSGKETSAKVNLDDVSFNVGKEYKVQLNGTVSIT